MRFGRDYNKDHPGLWFVLKQILLGKFKFAIIRFYSVFVKIIEKKRRNVNGIASMRCLSEEWNALSRL